MKRMSTLCATTAALLTLGTAPTQAAAQHDVFEESYDGSQHLDAGENPCGHWGATLAEVRSGSYRMVAAPGGQEDGEIHINGMVHGSLALVPDDPSRPAYAGTYREKIDGVLVGVDEDGNDVMRVAQYRLRAPLSTPDGDRLVLTMSGKVTLDSAGAMRVSRDATTCS